jgi:carboxymethylenebutenolidase
LEKTMTDRTITEREVEVPTPDGVADAVLFHPAGGPHPGVVFLPDGIGTRPSQRDMARRVAAEGYAVLLPNIYYRTARPPLFGFKADFAEERTRVRFAELTAPLTPDAMERDGAAWVTCLDAQPEVSDAPMGVVGLCFTGAYALRTAAARPDRIGAVASFHGGGLYRDDPASPHHVLPRVRAQLLFGHARDDRSMPADAITRLEESLTAWGGAFESETFDALHGWTVPDSRAWDEGEAERAFAKLRALFANALR